MKKCKKIIAFMIMGVLSLSSLQVKAADVLNEYTSHERIQESAIQELDSGIISHGETVTVTQVESQGSNCVFSIQGAVSTGYCAENSKDYWSYGTSKTGIAYEWDDAIVRKILYYAPGGLGYTGPYTLSGETSTGNDVDHATFATGYQNGDTSNRTKALAYIGWLANKEDPIKWGYQAYRIDIADPYQDVAYLGYIPKGSLDIIKYSSKPEITNANQNYSLAGAVYGIYAADGDYSEPEYTVTLKEYADGWAPSGLASGVKYGWGTISLPVGNYWVREITAPSGFTLDTAWYPSATTSITVTEGTRAYIYTNDAPQLGSLQIIKYSQNSQLTNDKSRYSLAGAVYGIYAADGDYSEPEYTVTLKEYADGWPASGLDKGVKYGWGIISGIPIGNYWIKEITAPPGFELDSNWYPGYHQPIYVGNDTLATVRVEDKPIIEVDLHLTKYQKGHEIAIPGAKFEHTGPDGLIETAVTDENGKLLFSNLKCGEHTVRELEAPEGYLLNEHEIEFSVKEDGTVDWISDFGENEQDVEFEMDAEGNIQIKIYEKPVPYSLVIHKENSQGTPLEGAEFGLYLDMACSEEVGSGITDADGILKFDGLIAATNYYLKERQAPTGYRGTVDENGNSVITELYVSNVPAQEEFKLYINGSEYEFSADGSYTLTGTKTAPAVNAVIVNETGYRLPETGSVGMPILLLATVFVFMTGWFLDKRHKNTKGRRGMKKEQFRKLFTMAFAIMLLVAQVVVIPARAATTNVESGVVDFGRGDAQVVITGNEGQSLKGKEFQLYRLFDAENSVGLESINYTFNPLFKTVLQTIVGGRIKKETPQVTEYEVIDYIQSLSQSGIEGSRAEQEEEGSYSEFRYFVETLRNEIVKEKIEGDVVQVASTSEWNSITIAGLEYGYYIIDEITDSASTHQATSLCMVNTANPNAAINIKSDYSTVVKKIQEDDNRTEIGNDGWNDIGDFEIGQDIPYKYESVIPNINGYSTYYWAWHDNMDEALTLQNDTIQITISGTVNGVDKKYTLLKDEFNLIVDSADTTFKIEIENIKELIDREFDNRDDNQENVYGQNITVTYNAFLNEKAVEDAGSPGFENDVRVEFSNNPNQGYESQTGFTPWDTVVCFTYQLDGMKVNNYGIPLEGAVFRLYTDESCETEVCVKKIEKGYQVIHRDRVQASDIDNNEGMTSDAKGEFHIYGLDSDTYYLKEVSAPKGYRLLLDPIKVKIAATTTNARENYVKGEGISAEIMELSVVNQIGKKLPVTGSQMMLVLVVGGVLLMLAAVIRRKKKHE